MQLYGIHGVLNIGKESIKKSCRSFTKYLNIFNKSVDMLSVICCCKAHRRFIIFINLLRKNFKLHLQNYKGIDKTSLLRVKVSEAGKRN